MRSQKLDPLKLRSFNFNFSAILIGNQQVNLDNGFLTGLSTLYRRGKLSITVDDNGTHVSLHLAASFLEIKYDVKVVPLFGDDVIKAKLRAECLRAFVEITE